MGVDADESPPEHPPRRGFVTSHPVITGVFATCIVVGAGLGIAFLPPEWALLRRALAGGVSGAGCALLVTATRIVG